MTQDQVEQAKLVLAALVDTIKEFPEGAPLGPMFMAFQMKGMSHDTFMSIIGQMEAMGLIKVRNHCAFWVAGRMQ